MSRRTRSRDTGCGNLEFHTEHLCYIVSQGFDVTDTESYQALVANPRFQCSHCGRKAGNEKHLCVPGRA
jgi:hypothetical protein